MKPPSISSDINGSYASRSGVLPVFVAFAFIVSLAPGSTTLFDNLAVGSSNGSSGVTNTGWAAQSFSTTASEYVLSEVAVRIWNLNGTSGNFEIQIWDAFGDSGRPGAQVGEAVYTGLAQDLGNSGGSLLTVYGLNFTLAPSKDYYLVAVGTSLTDVILDPFDPEFVSPGTLYWDVTDVSTAPLYSTGNSGASWNGPFPRDFYMRVAATAIPEPGSALALAGLLGGGLLIRRRNQRGL